MTIAFLVAFCLLISFLFSGLETGALLLNRARLRHLEEKGSWNARILQGFLHRPGSLSATVLVGNTLMDGLAIILVAQWFLRNNGFWVAMIAVSIFSVLMGLCCVLLPKALFQRFPNRFTPPLAPLLLVTYILLWPVIQVLLWMSRGIILLFGGKISSRQMFVTREELKYLAREVGEETPISGEQRNLIASILDARQATVRDVMRKKEDVITLSQGSTESDRLEKARATAHSRFPMVDEKTGAWGKVWVIYDHLFGLKDVQREAPVVSPGMRLEEALKVLQKARTPLAYVGEKEGHLIGLVTTEDILERYLGKTENP